MTGSDLRELEEHVKNLAHHLRELDDVDLSVLDLLDVLACAGLKLVPDEEGIASAAYFTRVPA